MPLFEVPKLNSREQDLALLKKSKTRVKTTTTTKSSGGSLVDKITAIKAMVETHLGKYSDETLIIQDEGRQIWLCGAIDIANEKIRSDVLPQKNINELKIFIQII